ncbi:MAG: adenylate/guanylate cyclase domain-containing protein [Polyangiaceae bacterium]|nr:adenylate/guanylate cyclase domain-containing protein [Polyangiaceae bacterium]
MKLLPKTLALLSLVAVAPVGVAVAALLEVNKDAVVSTERTLQVSIVSEVAAGSVGAVLDARSDAQAVAFALAEAAREKGDGGLVAVRAILATRTSIDAARFEVPSAKVSTVFKKSDAVGAEPPTSTPAAREEADRSGVGFAIVDRGLGALVVPIPRGGDGASGYVTVPVDLAALNVTLDGLAGRFRDGGAKLVVLDADRKIVASDSGSGLLVGGDGAALPVLARLGPGVLANPAAVVSEHAVGGEKMVGVVKPVPELSWAVAVWRPEARAYAALAAMKQKGLLAAAGALLLALLASVAAAGRVTSPVLALSRLAKVIGARRWRDVKVEGLPRDELGELGADLGKMAHELEASEEKIAEEARLRGDLSRFLSKELVTQIVEGKHSLALGGARAQVTVLFADVVSFTPLAESRPPEEVVALLNELFSLLTEIVFRHQGTVDKFIGDCLMAVWGAPVPAPDHAARAVAAAEDMLRFLENAAATWEQKYGVVVKLAIGINSGEAIVGNVGSDKRMEYTVIGDTVNIAARLEQIAAPNQVLVAGETARLAGDAFELVPVGARKLTGKVEEIEVYALDQG